MPRQFSKGLKQLLFKSIIIFLPTKLPKLMPLYWHGCKLCYLKERLNFKQTKNISFACNTNLSNCPTLGVNVYIVWKILNTQKVIFEDQNIYARGKSYYLSNGDSCNINIINKRPEYCFTIHALCSKCYLTSETQYLSRAFDLIISSITVLHSFH